MSSPLAKRFKSRLDGALIAAHRATSHSHRVRLLANALSCEIGSLAHGIDIGCGDMSLTRNLRDALPGSVWKGADIYPLPDATGSDPRWVDYIYLNGARLPFNDEVFDVALFVDVLHHVPASEREGLLREARRVARRVVIKDHYEYGAVSRTVLRAMDWFGNHAYGVSVPDRYFTANSFDQLVAAAGLHVRSHSVGMSLYEHLPILRGLLRREWHFIATLQ